MGEVTCNNCGLSWVDCDCWDTEDENNNGNMILALRLHNKLTTSKYLQAKEFWKEVEAKVPIKNRTKEDRSLQGWTDTILGKKED